MLILPNALPDELLISVLARMGRWNGITDLRDIVEGYLGDTPCTSFINARINLPKFCERTFNAYGTPDELLGKLTSIGLRCSLGEVSESEQSDIVQGDLKVSLSTLTFPNQTALRYCRSCIHDDIEQFGESYWHLSHQFPVVHICPRHGERLENTPLKRAKLHQSFPLPNQVVTSFMVSADREMKDPVAQGIAKMVEELIDRKIKVGNPDEITLVLLDGLQERKLATRVSAINSSDLKSYLGQELYGQPEVGASAKQWSFIRGIVRSVLEPRAGLISGRALLIYCLFGDIAAFRQRLIWLNVMGGSIPSPIRQDKRRRVEDIQAFHREICRKYIVENQGCSRMEFTKAEYRSFRWLLHNDSAWLDKYLPVPTRGGGRQYDLFN